MNATEEMTSLTKRLNTVLMVYVALCALHQYAHGLIDVSWSSTGQLTFLLIFGAVPVVAAALLWTAMKRYGGIIALGSLPAAILFLAMNRYIDKHQCVYPVEFSDVWITVYDVTFYLLAIAALAGSILAVQFLRALHAQSKPPANETP